MRINQQHGSFQFIISNTEHTEYTEVFSISDKKQLGTISSTLCIRTDNLDNKYNLDNLFYAAATASLLFMLYELSRLSVHLELRSWEVKEVKGS